MRRLAAVALALAMVASVSVVALAQEGPKVGGTLLVDIVYPFEQNAVGKFDYARARVNVTGSTGPSLDYSVRIQGENTAGVSVPLMFGTLKNVGGSGLNIGVGRQAVLWSTVNNYVKFYHRSGNVDGVTATYSLAPLTLNAFYAINDGQVGARAAYSSTLSGLDLSVSGQVIGVQGWKSPGFGVAGSVGLANIGKAYVEAGQGDRTQPTSDTQFIVVGANVDVLKAATGISGWFEYSLKDEKYMFSVGRELVPGLSLYLGGESASGKLTPKATAELSVSF